MSINIPSSASFDTKGLPTPRAAIKRLPIVVRDRMPHIPIPVEYEEACKALAACVSIDEGKHWSDKADALAAWAKIYKSDEAAIAARRLKLHAFRRMGEIAEELRPTPDRSGPGSKGSVSLLQEHGLPKRAAVAAASIARVPQEMFANYIKKGAGYSIVARDERGTGRSRSRVSEKWRWLTTTAQAFQLRSRFRSRNPHEVAAGIAKGEVKQARALVIELIEWLDAFEQALPKDAP